MVLTPEFPFPKCSAAGSAATQLSGSRNHPPQLFRVEILDHSSALLQTVLCGVAPQGCTASHSSYSEVARSPQSLVKLRIRVRIARFLPVITSYPPFRAQISCWQSLSPLPLSTWQEFGAITIDKARRKKRFCLCHCHQHVHFVTYFLNTEQMLEARRPNQQPIFPGTETLTALLNYKQKIPKYSYVTDVTIVLQHYRPLH